ncbi:MAG: hypothetical protein ABR505_01640 [Actinomycetota bacterium]
MLLSILLPSVAVADRRKPIRETYDVAAAPAPLAVSPSGWGCLDGIEGVHKVTKKFSVPWDGTLTATVKGFRGDWDIYAVDEYDLVVAYANHGVSQLALDEPDTLKYRARAGEQIRIVICNYLGGPTATGEYVFK